MAASPDDAPPPRSPTTGLVAPVIRSSSLRALVGLSFAIVLRLLREGLVVRALAWPGLLTAMSMFVSASATIAWRNNPVIYVSDSALVAPLELDAFEVTVDPNPEATLLDGRSERAVWVENGHYVLGQTWGGLLTLKAESRLRELRGDRWRIHLPPLVKRSRDSEDLGPITGMLAGIVGLLFTLYGVVIGAGSLYRDRSSGVLESDLALPIPRWTHAAARLVALATVLGPALVVSLLIVDALLPIHHIGMWMFECFVAALLGGVLGVALMARSDARRGFSGPLSQALTLNMAMVSLGYWAPDVGRFFPLLSLGSAFKGQEASLVVIPMTLLIAAFVSADFHRRDCV